MVAEGLNITMFLKEISTRLNDAAATARAGLTCAESGSDREALRITMNIDEMIYEVKLLHGAMRLVGRAKRDQETLSSQRP